MGDAKKYLIQPSKSSQIKLKLAGIMRLNQSENTTAAINVHPYLTHKTRERTLPKKTPILSRKANQESMIEIKENEKHGQGNGQQTPKFTNLTTREKKSMIYNVPQNDEKFNYSFYSSHGASELKPQVNFRYSKDPGFEERQEEGLEQSSYLSYDPDPSGLNETELLALRIEHYLLEKENNFYHTGKVISNLVIALYAISLALIFIAVGVATYIANQTNGRRKRDIDEALYGGYPNLSLTCIAKMMCELQQQEELFGPLSRENVRFEKRPRISRKKRTREDKDRFTVQKTGRKSQRRRSRRQLSYKRDCSNVYQRCSLNFSIFFRLWKMFFT